jgi:hypothetical protein
MRGDDVELCSSLTLENWPAVSFGGSYASLAHSLAGQLRKEQWCDRKELNLVPMYNRLNRGTEGVRPSNTLLLVISGGSDFANPC